MMKAWLSQTFAYLTNKRNIFIYILKLLHQPHSNELPYHSEDHRNCYKQEILLPRVFFDLEKPAVHPIASSLAMGPREIDNFTKINI